MSLFRKKSGNPANSRELRTTMTMTSWERGEKEKRKKKKKRKRRKRRLAPYHRPRTNGPQ
jgi:hypothetical protein